MACCIMGFCSNICNVCSICSGVGAPPPRPSVGGMAMGGKFHGLAAAAAPVAVPRGGIMAFEAVVLDMLLELVLGWFKLLVMDRGGGIGRLLEGLPQGLGMACPVAPAVADVVVDVAAADGVPPLAIAPGLGLF